MRAGPIFAVALTLAGCADYSREVRHLVYANLEAMAVVETVAVAGPYQTASLVVLVPKPIVLAGETYIGTRSEEVIDCAGKRSRRLSIRGVFPDGTEAAPVPNTAAEWTAPGPNTPSGRMIQAVCQPAFARSTATHSTLKRLRANYLKQLALK